MKNIESTHLSLIPKIAIAVLLLMLTGPSYAKEVKVTVVTEILPIDPVPGVKSTQNVVINTGNWTVTSEFETGTTYGIPSVDDVFIADVSTQPDSSHVVTIKGATETGAGLGFAPAINYTVILDFDPDGSYKMYGTHDGYPAYTVKINGTAAYNFEHQSLELANLSEPEEINIPESNHSL